MLATDIVTEAITVSNEADLFFYWVALYSVSSCNTFYGQLYGFASNNACCMRSRGLHSSCE